MRLRDLRDQLQELEDEHGDGLEVWLDDQGGEFAFPVEGIIVTDAGKVRLYGDELQPREISTDGEVIE